MNLVHFGRIFSKCIVLSLIAGVSWGEDSLVAHYRFNEGSGTVLHDCSGHGNDGKIMGAVWTEGHQGTALDLEGRRDIAVCPDALLTRLRGPMTISVWIKSQSRKPQPLVIRGCWDLSLASGGIPVFAARDADADKRGKLRPVRSTQAIALDQWVMITGVYDTDRQVMEVYINDKLRGSLPKTDGSIGGPFRTKLLLGNNSRRGLDGLMGETRIYKRALSSDDIRELQKTTRPDKSIDIPGCRLRVTPYLFVGERKLHVQPYLVQPYPKEKIRVQVELFRKGGEKSLAEGVVEGLPSRTEKVHIFDLAGMESGEYEVRATVFTAVDNVLLAKVAQPVGLPEKKAWSDVKDVTFNDVPLPWISLIVESDDLVEPQMHEDQINVLSLGRAYTFGPHPMPEQISTAGHELLAKPIRLSGRVDGRDVQWNSGFPVVNKETDAEVVLSMKASDPALTFENQVTIEFDGLMRFDCTLKPEKKVRLEKLTIEIPFRREHARLIYYYRDKLFQPPGLLPEEGVVRAFNPAIWLGTEEYGLQWFTESDQDWYMADANRAIEIVPDGEEVILRLNLVTSPITLDPGAQPTLASVPQLQYTFGLQATPVKPITQGAWDLRINTTPVFNDQYALLDMEIEGKPAIQYYAEKGVETLFLKSSWNGIMMYPDCRGNEDKLHRMVKACHEQGMKLIVYLGSYFTDKSPEFEDYQQDFAAWRRPKPYSSYSYYGNTPPGKAHKTCLACNGSDSWREFMLAGAERLMDRFDIDGFFLDGLGTASPCHNVHHGCGVLKPNGRVTQSYPFFDCRDTVRRLRAIVKSHKPDGIIDFHAGGSLNSAIFSWVDNIWDGETILGPIRKADRKDRLLTEYLPLDLFRGQFLGRQWGVSTEFVCLNVPYPYEQLWAMTLLHDVPIRADDTGDDLRALQLESKIWNVMDAFERKEAEWRPYWTNSDCVSVQPKDAHVSLYNHPENGVLAVVSNLGKERAEVKVAFSLEKLGLAATSTARDAMSGEDLVIEGGLIVLDLGSVDWKLVWITP